jgi:8-oxo-dGTP diphosphatase
MFTQSISFKRFQIIPRTLILIFNQDCILLIRQKEKGKIGYKLWNGVGGHIEKGEDPLSSARREIKEETGLEINDLSLRFISIIKENRTRDVCLFIFESHINRWEVKESAEGELKWIKISEINKYSVMKDLPQLLKLVKQKSSVQFLRYLKDEQGELHLEII